MRRPALSLAIGVSALFGPGLLLVWLLTGSIGNDFSVYWRAANGPLAEVYADAFDYPFPYAPPMLLWIRPLAHVSQTMGFFAWVFASAATMALVCRRHLTWPMTVLVLLSPPLINGLATGQVSCLIAAGVLWACGTDRRWIAGMALGLIATVKPQLVAAAPLLLLVRRDWWAIGGAATSFLTVLALTFLVFGAEIWSAWFDSLGYFRWVLNHNEIIGSVPTPAGQAENWGLPAQPFWIAGIIAALWLVTRKRAPNALRDCAVITTASLLAAPYALTYDLAGMAPFLVEAVFAGSIAAALALVGMFHPVPLLISTILIANPKGTLGRIVRFRDDRECRQASAAGQLPDC